MVIDEEATAVAEVAKTTRTAIGATEKLGKFISKYIGGPLEQAVGIYEDKLKYRRFENQLALMERAQILLKKKGLSQPSNVIPLKLAVPLFEYASLEDEEELQELWAALLVNAGTAGSGVDVKLAYIEILKSISALEAQILNQVYSINFEEALHKGVFTKDLPQKVSINTKENSTNDNELIMSDELKIALSNLDRIGCLSIVKSMGGGHIFSLVNPTLLGASFVRACQVVVGRS